MEPSSAPLESTRWQRFISKLAGGPPNLEKLEAARGKHWFVRHKASLYAFVLGLAILVMPEVVSQLNRVPEPTELRTMQVRILKISETAPHFRVELADGQQRDMEWPVGVTAGRGKYRSYVWSDDERKQLLGCRAIINGVTLRWTFIDHFRVWEIDCPEKGIHIGLDRTEKDYGIWIAIHRNSSVFIYSMVYFFIFIMFLREKRGNL